MFYEEQAQEGHRVPYECVLASGKRLFAVALLLSSLAVKAVSDGEVRSSGTGGVFDSAQARNRDAETLKVLSAEGQLLYRREPVRLDGYRYCSQAVALAERGELRASIRSASMAMHVGVLEGNDDLLALSKRDLAIAYSYAGDLVHAEQYAREALTHKARDPRIVSGPAYKTLGDIAVRRGQLAEAIDWYTKADAAASDRFRPLVKMSLANAFVSSGDAKRARSLYAQLSPPEDGLRAFFERGLGNLLLVEGKPTEALQAFEIAKAAASGADAGYHQLWAVEGVARSQLALGDKAAARSSYIEAAKLSESIRSRFRSEEFKTGLFGDMQEVFERAISLSMDSGDIETAWLLSERSRARALLDIVRDRVTPVRNLDEGGNAVSLADLTGTLREGETLVQFHSLDDQLIVWTVTTSGLRGKSLPISRAELDRGVDALRQSIFDRRRETMDLAADLYQKLLSPLALPAGQRLIVIPHGGLHYLPFQALRGPDGYLIERNALAIAPSASLAVQLARRRGGVHGQLVAFGNPSNDAREDLPGAEREVQRISTLFADRRIYLQHDASKSRFREAAGTGRILHVAAHAEVDNIDPLHSRILLAAEKADTGFLEAREVFGVDLKGVSLVTLSACESGLGRIARGDEIQGFTRSFLGAGASGLVVSLWPVADDSTELLMTTLYSEIAGGAQGIDAMRSAQLEVMKQRKFAHPFFWAPFNLIGDWRLQAGD